MATPAAPPANFDDSDPASASSSSSPNSEPTLPATVFDPDTLVKRGWCTVANDKNRAANPHKLYYGQHPCCSPASAIATHAILDSVDRCRTAWRR